MERYLEDGKCTKRVGNVLRGPVGRGEVMRGKVPRGLEVGSETEQL